MKAGLPKREFLQRVDELRPRFHEIVCDHYADPYFAKLLWLKATNYVIAKYHHLERHARLASRPVTLMLDPCNSCQLSCPGCVHSSNQKFTKNLIWPAGVMRTSTFGALLRELGPFCLNAILYNYGEPLLNKNIADFIELAHGYGMKTGLSTNLSVEFDVERFVRAGADHVVLSIDGITQETYARFRKQGDLGLVLDNVRRLVELKRKYGQAKPFLIWRFFTFEHNVHEVDAAIDLADEIGVDRIVIGTPFDVSIDDPSVRVATSERRGAHSFDRSREHGPAPRRKDLLVRHEEVERLFEEPWFARAGDALDEPAHPGGACLWLYYNMTIDAVGRIMPCCISPTSKKRLVYGNLAEHRADKFNADDFVLSRLAFGDPAGFQEMRAHDPQRAAPWCASCPKQPALTYDPLNGVQDLYELDFQASLFDPKQPFWWRFARWE